MAEIKYEIRSFSGDAAPKASVDSRHIEGYAIVFNQRSQLIFDWNNGRPVYEIIQPGAVDDSLIRKSDIKALLEHNGDRMLARSINGQGSMRISIDDIGVKYVFDAPNTADGNYALEEIRRGDLFGSSFAYWTDNDKNVDYYHEGDNLIRSVKKIDVLRDFSIVGDPAYMGTSVETRSIEKRFAPKNDEKEKAEQELMKSQLAELRKLSNYKI
jgi:uncharacterized protein